MPLLLSVNIGRPRPNPWKGERITGMDKRPVTGPVTVTAPGPKGTGMVGLAGDRVHDTRHHGGDDQAVYAYASEDLATWAEELTRDLRPGIFGENLTTQGLDVNGALIGERWQIGGTVVLEVTCPRIPCATFHGWMNEPDWLRRFTARGVPGAYLRVVTPGEITAGDEIKILDRPSHGTTIRTAFRTLMR
jgi:MOSC domain-containing protein YiiM